MITHIQTCTPGRARSGRARSGRAHCGSARSGRARSCRARSGKVLSGRARSGRILSSRNRSGKALSGRLSLTLLTPAGSLRQDSDLDSPTTILGFPRALTQDTSPKTNWPQTFHMKNRFFKQSLPILSENPNRAALHPARLLRNCSF